MNLQTEQEISMNAAPQETSYISKTKKMGFRAFQKHKTVISAEKEAIKKL